MSGNTIDTTTADDADRVMNDTTMPPPPRRQQQTAIASVTKSSNNIQTKNKPVPRKKVGRFGLSEWTRLLNRSNDLAQRKGQPLRKIRWNEINKHNNIHDGWIVIKNKVYFISPYLPYHPGGETILKPILGKDATQLFDKYHRWVNEDGLIAKLLLGYLDTSSNDDDDDSEDDNEKKSYIPQMSKDGFAIPAPRKP